MSKFSPLWSSRAPAILRYVVAVLSVAAALVAGLLLDMYLHSVPYVSLFFCAVIFAARFGGAGPGLLGGRIWASPNAGPEATFQFSQPPGEAGAR